jgi:hypothetical protein
MLMALDRGCGCGCIEAAVSYMHREARHTHEAFRRRLGHVLAATLPRTDVGYASQSDRLLRCRKMTLWANSCRTHPQQKQQAISSSDRGAGATCLNNPATTRLP